MSKRLRMRERGLEIVLALTGRSTGDTEWHNVKSTWQRQKSQKANARCARLPTCVTDDMLAKVIRNQQLDTQLT